MQALWDLGETPDAIARALKEQGIVGRRQNPTECPVAHHLRFTLGLQGVQVWSDLVTGLSKKDEDTAVVPPTAVRDFVERFDAGAYAELATPSQRKRRVGMKVPRKNTEAKILAPGSETGKARPTATHCKPRSLRVTG